MRLFPWIVCLPLAFLPSLNNARAQTPAQDPAEIDHIENNTVYLKGTPTPLRLPTLFDLKPIGALRAANGQPYFLLSARPCQNCTQDPGIYAVRPPTAAAPDKAAPTGYVFPGRILDPRSRSLLSESRAFYGHCLRSRAGEILVIFQREKVDRRGMQSSVLIAELPSKEGTSHLEETLLERHLPRLNDTLKLVRSHACHEIEGRHRLMANHLIDVRSLHDRDPDSSDNGDDDANDDASPETTVN
jgi:hypothetical protein